MIRVEVRRLPNGVVTLAAVHTWWDTRETRAKELIRCELNVVGPAAPDQVLRTAAATIIALLDDDEHLD